MTKTISLNKKLAFPTVASPSLFKVAAPGVKSSEKTVKPKKNTVALKDNVKPGHVVILLTGRFKGKRVVVLKQLDSGLLLVSGPFKVNGVPLKRVNQKFVIGTSTKVDISKVNVESINDALFSREGEKKISSKDLDFFTKESMKKKEVSAARVAAQKSVDAALEGSLDADLKAYLGARFTLRNNVFPHALKF